MRAIWSGALSFGLVNIPVRLLSATKDERVKFRMLHKTDLCPIGYRRICKTTGKEVPSEEIGKGYEYGKDEFVLLDDADFRRANERKVKTLEVVAFVREQEVDAKYFEKPYYLEPEKKSERAYVLLREALKKAKRVGVVRFVLHNREHVGVLKPESNVLVLEQIRYAAAMRPLSLVEAPGKQEIAEQEMQLALLLIEQLSRPFVPEEYEDTYTNELEQVIAAKVKGRKPKKKGAVPEPTAVPDLMSALMESLQQRREEVQV